MANVRACVLAAGRGVRMGGAQPKTLIPLGEHEPMLHYILRGLKQAGIEDLMVVTGFQPEKIQSYVEQNWGEATYVFNARYASWGNFHSVRVALDPRLLSAVSEPDELREPLEVIALDLDQLLDPLGIEGGDAESDAKNPEWFVEGHTRTASGAAKSVRRMPISRTTARSCGVGESMPARRAASTSFASFSSAPVCSFRAFPRAINSCFFAGSFSSGCIIARPWYVSIAPVRG